MKVVSCIKQVRNLDDILPYDWVVDKQKLGVNIDYANRIMNTYDEMALEIMLQLCDASSDIESTTITIGDKNSETILRKALAIGVDNVVRIDKGNEVIDDPYYIASLLKAELLDQGDVELILCGRQADNGNNGQTGQILAAMLGLPCITMVVDIRMEDDKFLVSHLTSTGIEHVCIQGPLVVCVTQLKDKYLRMATLMASMEAKRKPIKQKNAQRYIGNENYTLSHISIDKCENSCVFLEDTPNESKIEQLMNLIVEEAKAESSL